MGAFYFQGEQLQLWSCWWDFVLTNSWSLGWGELFGPSGLIFESLRGLRGGSGLKDQVVAADFQNMNRPPAQLNLKAHLLHICEPMD